MRFDEERGIYRDCRWCGGKGCLSCPAEADKEYRRQFPDGPKPIATFDITTEAGIRAAKEALGPEAIEAAYATGEERAKEALKPGGLLRQLLNQSSLSGHEDDALPVLSEQFGREALVENIIAMARKADQ